MKRLFGAGLTGVFLVCGCGGEAAVVIKGYKGKVDLIVQAKLRAPASEESKIEKAEELSKKLGDKRRDLVAKCVTKLMKTGKSAADAKLRVEGAKELAILADRSATHFLMEQAVHDESNDVKVECIRALGQLEDYTSVPVLIQLLEDLNVEIAGAALDSLNMICRPVTYREFTFSGSALRERKKTAHQWRRWWDKGGKDQLAKHAEEG